MKIAFVVATLFLSIATLRAETPATQPSSGVLSFSAKSLDGKDVNLSQYAGKVLLIVNTASKCGNTPQYEDLENLYKKYKDRGFMVLGFPANNFRQQEPGTNKEIAEFCTQKYGVTFDMFEKINVKGAEKSPLYQYLTDASTDPKFSGDISWNFEKFLIDRNGNVVGRFKPGTKPNTPEVVNAIEAELAK